MKERDTYEILMKLIGPIDPVGSSHVDEDRLVNLEEAIEVAHRLLSDIRVVASYKSRYEHSMMTAGKAANKFLEFLDEYKL